METKATLTQFGVNTPLVELLNLATNAELIALCALQRHESRGGHYCLDFPSEVERERKPSVVSKASQRTMQRGAPTGIELDIPMPGSSKAAGGLVSANGMYKAGIRPLPKRNRLMPREMMVRSMPQDGGN